MGTGIVTQDRAIEALPHHVAVLHQHSANRHLALLRAQARLRQRQAHEVLVTRAIDDLRSFHCINPKGDRSARRP